MEERRVDAAWRKIKPQELDLRGQFDAVFQTHFRFASAHVRDIWNEWSARVSARDSTLANRSEERRVGKEGRYGRGPRRYKEKEEGGRRRVAKDVARGQTANE